MVKLTVHTALQVFNIKTIQNGENGVSICFYGKAGELIGTVTYIPANGEVCRFKTMDMPKPFSRGEER